MRRLARTDPLTRFELLSLREVGKTPRPILPLESDDVDAFRNSPLFSLTTADDDPSEMASSLMGPGPWTFHQDMKLPNSCSLMRTTNKNRRSNVIITHLFKCIMRVERGDDLYLDPKTGKRKLFDVVVHTPITVLSVSVFTTYSDNILTFSSADVTPSGPRSLDTQNPSMESPPLYRNVHVKSGA